MIQSMYAYIYAAPGPPTNIEVARIAERAQLTVTWEPPTNPNGVILSKHPPHIVRYSFQGRKTFTNFTVKLRATRKNFLHQILGMPYPPIRLF
jgi:hypothetical protein